VPVDDARRIRDPELGSEVARVDLAQERDQLAERRARGCLENIVPSGRNDLTNRGVAARLGRAPAIG